VTVQELEAYVEKCWESMTPKNKAKVLAACSDISANVGFMAIEAAHNNAQAADFITAMTCFGILNGIAKRYVPKTGDEPS
jgi:hypothetical protein